jgi:NAD(P)-dependent dehydrogenase (short-subunit alcohol dehydrogenase family)
LAGDLSKLASVRELAATILSRCDALHVLISNADVYMTKRELTDDGFEMTFAVNHLAPFLLTHLLVDRLRQNAPPGVIDTKLLRQGFPGV